MEAEGGKAEVSSGSLKLYHVVSRDTAIMVLLEGFWDADDPLASSASSADWTRGVFLTERPVDAQDGFSGDWNTVLEVEFPAGGSSLNPYKIMGDTISPYWIVPAEIVNEV